MGQPPADPYIEARVAGLGDASYSAPEGATKDRLADPYPASLRSAGVRFARKKPVIQAWANPSSSRLNWRTT